MIQQKLVLHMVMAQMIERPRILDSLLRNAVDHAKPHDVHTCINIYMYVLRLRRRTSPVWR